LEESKTIDMTPNWETVARIYTGVMENNDGSAAGRRAAADAREGLVQMGSTLDRCMEQLDGKIDDVLDLLNGENNE